MTNGCTSCSSASPSARGDLLTVMQRGRLISALFGGAVAGLSPQAKPLGVSLFLRIGGTALAAWNLAVFIEQQRQRK